MNVNANAKNGIQKILQQKLKDVPKGNDIAKDIQNSISKLLFTEPTQPNKDTKGDIEGFFTDIQDGVRELQTDTNQQKNLKKVKQDSPEQSKIALGESFLDEFDRMVEEVQDKYTQNKNLRPLIESYKKSIKKIKGSILKESKNKVNKKTINELIVQTRHQTNTFFESVGLNKGNKKYHEYLEKISDNQFKYLQNEGKRLIIEESTKLLKPYFRKNKNRFKIKQLIREGFETAEPHTWVKDPETQMVPVDPQPVEYQEEIPQWKDEVMMDDYDFQFMFLNYLDNNESLVVSNNPELEQKLMDLQASLYENTNDLETGWENETGIQQEIMESEENELFGDEDEHFLSKLKIQDKDELLRILPKIDENSPEGNKQFIQVFGDMKIKELPEPFIKMALHYGKSNYHPEYGYIEEDILNDEVFTYSGDLATSLKKYILEEIKKKQQITKSSYNLNEQENKESIINKVVDFFKSLQKKAKSNKDLMDILEKEKDALKDLITIDTSEYIKDSINLNEQEEYTETQIDEELDSDSFGQGQLRGNPKTVNKENVKDLLYKIMDKNKNLYDELMSMLHEEGKNTTDITSLIYTMNNVDRFEDLFYSTDFDEPKKYKFVSSINNQKRKRENQKKANENNTSNTFGKDLK